MRELALKSNLIAEWRRAIVKARIQLVEPGLSQQQEQALWATVDYGEKLIRLVAFDFNAEMEQIDREIENELRAPACRSD